MPNSTELARADAILGPHVTRHGDSHCLSAVLEIADRCNETCAHCYQEQGNKGEISTEAWKKVIDDLADLGVLLLTFSGGEATLRHDFLDLVAHARSQGFAVKVFSNGLNIDAALADKLADLAVHEVQISLYSHRADVHDWITGVPGSHGRTVAAIEHLVARRIHVLAKSPMFSINIDQVDDYIKFVESLGANYSVDPELKPRETGARDPQGLTPSRAQVDRLLQHPTFQRGGHGVSSAAPRDPTARPCGACRTMTVEANGEVRACALLTVPLGNALDEGVVHAYRHGDTSNFIRSLSWGDILGCRDCDLSGACHRCYSDARFEGGDALRPYSSACSRALAARERSLGRPVIVEGFTDAPPLGPFRLVAEDRVQAFEPEVTERDRKMREQQPWILHEPQPAVPSATETQLVQIRRPGRAKPIGGKLPLAGAKP